MRLILFLGFPLGKMWKNMEKRPFFRAAMARLGKYRMGGYGRIGVYRVKLVGFGKIHGPDEIQRHQIGSM